MFIKEDLYKEIIKSVPVLCVDILICLDDKYLLVKRNDNPLKGEWWVPGGRVLIGEDCISAAKRKLSEELNILTSNLRIYGIYEDNFEESSFGAHHYHTVSIVYLLEVNDINNINLNSTSSDWKLHDKIPERLKNNLIRIN